MDPLLNQLSLGLRRHVCLNEKVVVKQCHHAVRPDIDVAGEELLVSVVPWQAHCPGPRFEVQHELVEVDLVVD